MQQENVEPQTLAPPLLAVFFFVLCFCFVLGGAVFVFTATTTTTTTTIAASIEQVPIFVTYVLVFASRSPQLILSIC